MLDLAATLTGHVLPLALHAPPSLRKPSLVFTKKGYVSVILPSKFPRHPLRLLRPRQAMLNYLGSDAPLTPPRSGPNVATLLLEISHRAKNDQ